MMTAPQQHQPLYQRQQHSQHQQSRQQDLNNQLDTATYDPDEIVLRDSPLMKALHPKLELSPSPPPEIPPGQVSSSPPSTDDCVKSNRPKIVPYSGDSILVRYLDNGRRPEIAQTAGSQVLPGAEEEFESCSEDAISGNNTKQDNIHTRAEGSDVQSQLRDQSASGTLQTVAVDALHVYPVEPQSQHPLHNVTTDISISTRLLSIHDERLPGAERPGEHHSASNHPSIIGSRSPAQPLTPASGELPPLQIVSPKSESNFSQSLNLPSIRSTLGDIDRLPAEPPTPTERDLSVRHSNHTQVFPHSPPVGLPPFPPVPTNKHTSPPISPNESFQRSVSSPHSNIASSPFYFDTNGPHKRTSVDYLSNTSLNTPKTEYTTSTPATAVSVAERMSIDGITHSQVGIYVCNFAGCTAPPFQTQYLLNSHANVHSSARPHYCPVPGCPRSEGGKGFKRKNEMIRHGLVHDSPGYVCPFCEDREHKYPRPDNLQRHVRVHHLDKDKDDPLLRDVLAQRPDGPNRGRRRRVAST